MTIKPKILFCYNNNEIIRLDTPEIHTTEDEYEMFVYENVVYISHEKLRSRLHQKSKMILSSLGINDEFTLKYEWNRSKFEITNLPPYNGIYKAKLAYCCDFVSHNTGSGNIIVKWQLVQVIPKLIDYFD